MVNAIDFFTSFGHGEGGDHRRRLGIATEGPALLVTDLAVWQPDPVSKAFTVVSIHPGATREQIEATCCWEVRYAADVTGTPAPTALELTTLRDLQERTRIAHEGSD
jgi:glutaconate CoA-transferase subunit B